MFSWIAANIGTVIVCALLLAVVALVVRSMIRNKKQGKSSCGCGCSTCAMGGACHKNGHE